MPTSELKGILKHVSRNKQLPPVPVQDASFVASEDVNPYTPRHCPPYSPKSEFHPKAQNARRSASITSSVWLPCKHVNGRTKFASILHSSPEQEQEPSSPLAGDWRKKTVPKHDTSRYKTRTEYYSQTRAAQPMPTRDSKPKARRNVAYSRKMSLSTSSSSSRSTNPRMFRRPMRSDFAPVKALTIRKRTPVNTSHICTHTDHTAPQTYLQRKRRVIKRGSTSEVDNNSTKRELKTSRGNPKEVRESGLRLEKKRSKRKSRVYEEPGTVHNLPLVLAADQAYECLVQWESEKEEFNNAEQLWRKLEQECGIVSPCANAGDRNSRVSRGRWKVKVVETPVLSSPVREKIEENEPPSWTEDTLFTNDNAGSRIPFSGVLQEVEDVIPSLSTYHRLVSTVIRRRTTRRRSSRRQSRCAVHAHLKRTLQGLWEEILEEEEVVWCREMMRLQTLSRSRSKPSRSQSRRLTRDGDGQFKKADVVFPLNVGLGIIMGRSSTMKSVGAESLIDLYT